MMVRIEASPMSATAPSVHLKTVRTVMSLARRLSTVSNTPAFATKRAAMYSASLARNTWCWRELDADGGIVITYIPGDGGLCFILDNVRVPKTHSNASECNAALSQDQNAGSQDSIVVWLESAPAYSQAEE